MYTFKSNYVSEVLKRKHKLIIFNVQDCKILLQVYLSLQA